MIRIPQKRDFKMKTRKKLLIILLISAILTSGLSVLGFQASKTKAEFNIQEFSGNLDDNLATIQGNSLLSVSNPSNPEPKVIKKLIVIVTGYSSTEDQTDSDPFITAAGTIVREGVVATNILPFGTKIKLPELYGEKVFVVEDRMSWKKGNYHIDIWFPNREDALEFGAKITEALILLN